MNTTIFKRKAYEIEEGDGVRVNRLFPVRGFMNFDPFVLMDEFFVDSNNGFPTHPHRGFEAITYIIEGALRHQDNLGNDTTVRDGGVQMFTAGSGMSHSEMPLGKGINYGFQIWFNLPKKLKKINPAYRQINADEFPIEKGDGYQVKSIVGNASPLKLKTDVTYQDIKLNANHDYKINLEGETNSFIFLVNGKILVNSVEILVKEAWFSEGEKAIEIHAVEDSRMLFLSGKPHRESILQHGPYVD